MIKSLLILCLGNEIISDDGFGPEVARQLLNQDDLSARADIIFAPVAGFHILDLLTGREKVLIVDTIQTGKAAPGTLHSFPADVFAPTQHLTTSHQISLPAALDLGRLIGMDIPQVIDVLAVEAKNLETLSEEISLPVRQAISEALGFIEKWIIKSALEEENHEGRY